MGLIQDAWNTVTERKKETKQRNHIRASEIGMPYIDRYYAMCGTPPTNPFSERALRIFDNGRVVEWVVLRALAMAGILNRKGADLELPETEDHLSVRGKLDATIGGITDWASAREAIHTNMREYGLDMGSEMLEERAERILDGLQQQYPEGWPEEMCVEVKSINSMAFWSYKKNSAGGHFLGYPHNRLQLYAYLKMAHLRQGILLYVSKDDFTLEEVSVVDGDPELEAALWEDLRTMSKYHRAGLVPPKEKELIYNEKKGAFEVNWAVTRSLYLSKIYGHDDAKALEQHHHQLILDLNRALRHARDGKLKPEDTALIEKYRLDRFI